MADHRIADRYEPIEVLGRGGEATVVKAIDTRHERLVALKIRPVSPHETPDALLVEVRALLSLPPHPGLAHARDDLFDRGRHVLVLDWVDGMNLARVLAEAGRPGLPVSSVLRWCAQAAEVLTFLHGHGVVHGDVKPANLIIDGTGRVVVVDLGSSSIPMSEAVRGGTPGFRAPEIAGGDASTRAADVFSLGATAFALLTGEAPAGGAPKWNGVPSDVAARLETALRGALSIDPARRPASPGVLVERLRAGWNDETPTGVGTVMLTDVVGSTELWEQTPERVPALLADLQLTIDRSVEDHGGRRYGATVEGDASVSAFPNAINAVRAAVALQRALSARPDGVRVRIGLATGELVNVDDDIRGPTLNRAARVRDFARAGEILLSESTASVLAAAPPTGVDVIQLGEHQLRGIDGTDDIVAVVADGVTAPRDPTRSPYPGLAPFSPADADLFFGREDVVARCSELLRAHGFVAIVGASGSGKSSVALAGLAPHVADAIVLRPGARPLDSLETADVGAHPNAVLIVDQLEEVFTLDCDHEDRATFIARIDAHPGGCLVTVRADLYGEFGAFPDFARRLETSQVLLGALRDEDLVRAVEEPARRCGLAVEPGLAELIVAELSDAPGTLPLLGHALREAWSRREGRRITVAGYRESGGVHSAVAATAERAISALDDDGRDVARRVVLRMVELRSDGEDARRWASRHELVEVDPQRAHDVVATLTDARLLVVDRDQITLVHEALLRAWPRLDTWIAEQRAELLVHQELRGAAERWDDDGRTDADLYRGLRLDAAVELASRERLPAREAEFVDAGLTLRNREASETRRRARRLRILVVATSILAVVALLVGVVAIGQRNDAQDAQDAAEASERAARIEGLVGQSESMRASQRDVAALLAVEAFRLADTASTRSALLSTFTDSEGFLDAHHVDAATASSGIVLPDGDSAYLATDTSRLHPYDLDTGELGAPMGSKATGAGQSGPLAASADGALLAHAVWPADSNVRRTTIAVYETATNSEAFAPITLDGWVETIAFSPDGTNVALTVDDLALSGRLVVLDAATGSTVATQPPVTLTSDQSGISAVTVVGPDFVVGTPDGSLRFFDAVTGMLRGTLTTPTNTISHLHPLADGTMVTAGRFGISRVRLDDGTVLWQHAVSDDCENFAVVPEQETFYCGDLFGRLVERDIQTGHVIRNLDAQNGNSGSLQPARGGTELVGFSLNEPVVGRWRLDGSGPITRLVAPGWDVVDLNPSGEYLIVGRDDPAFDNQVVDTSTGKVVNDLDGLLTTTWLDADTVGGAMTLEGVVELGHVDVDGGRLVPDDFTLDPIPVDAITESGKDVPLLVYEHGERKAIAPLNLETRRIGTPIEIDSSISLTISRTGRRIGVGGPGGALLFDGDSGELVAEIPGDDDNGVFITVADQLFTSSGGGEITQYDLDSLEPIRSFGGSRGYVQRIHGPADGSIIVAGGGDRAVTLFDVATGIRIGTPIQLGDDEFNDFAVSLDGRILAAGGGPERDGVQIWDLDPARWETAACEVAGRNLTREEWATHIGDLAPYHATCPQLPVAE